MHPIDDMAPPLVVLVVGLLALALAAELLFAVRMARVGRTLVKPQPDQFMRMREIMQRFVWDEYFAGKREAPVFEGVFSMGGRVVLPTWMDDGEVTKQH